MQNEQATYTKPQIEAIIDRIGMEDFMELLTEICMDKGDHLRSNWQDEKSAKEWERVGIKLSKINIANIAR